MGAELISRGRGRSLAVHMFTRSVNSHCIQLQGSVLLDKYNHLMLLYMPQGIQEIHTELDEMALYQEESSSSLSSIRVQA